MGVHERLIAKSRVYENGEGPVVTMGYMQGAGIRSDSQGRIVDKRGRLVNVLHQYDRQPELARGLLDHLGLVG